MLDDVSFVRDAVFGLLRHAIYMVDVLDSSLGVVYRFMSFGTCLRSIHFWKHVVHLGIGPALCYLRVIRFVPRVPTAARCMFNLRQRSHQRLPSIGHSIPANAAQSSSKLFSVSSQVH